jgi:murein DD-endopeptidase MepM/ murein hydrolase activator NlpD
MLNIPGSSGTGPKKTKLVADLTAEQKTFNAELAKTKTLSSDIADNLTRARGGRISGGGFLSEKWGGVGGGANPLGFVNEPGSGGTGSSMSFGRAGATAAVTGLTALSQMVDPSQYIENDIARRRFGFYAGVNAPGGNPMGYTRTNAGTQVGTDAFKYMMQKGTSISAMDAAQAAMYGASNGMMPGLSNYQTVMSGAAAASNLTPGIGLQGGMEAMVALNQASSVNKLRMIGIQVRNDKGLMRSYTDIANDLWNMINRQRIGSSPLTAQDLSISLQPGNSLDSLLNQYFGNDPVLRQNIVAALMAKAQGANLNSKKDLARFGVDPNVAQSGANRNAAAYNAISAYTTSGVQGVEGANSVIAGAANTFANAVNQFGGIVAATTALQTLGGAGNNAGATLFSGGLSIAKDLFMLRAISKFSKGGAPSAPSAPVENNPGLWAEESASGAAGASRFAGLMPGLGFLALGTAGLYAGASLTGSQTAKAFKKAGINYNAWSKDFSGPDSARAVEGLRNPALVKQWQEKYPMGGDSSPGFSGGVGDSSPTSNGAYVPLQEKLVIPTNGEFWNQAPFRKQPHHGVDFHADTGKPVFAIKDGEVIKSGEEGDLGTMIRIRHADGYNTVYGHLSAGLVSGGKVRAGQQIGFSGYSGGVYPKGPAGAHLHVALEESKSLKVHDPVPYINGGAHPTGGVSGVYSGSSTQTTPSGASATDRHSLFNMNTNRLFSGLGDSSPAASSAVVSSPSQGGVTVHINVSGANMDEYKLAREVKRVLEEDERMRMAVSR